MKSTISDIRQVFNVKTYVNNTAISDLVDGDFGIFKEDSNTSIPIATTTLALLPAKVRFISNLNGKLYFSNNIIEKSKIVNKEKRAYQAEVADIWKVTIKNPTCIDSIKLRININNHYLIQRDGLTWTHGDTIVASPTPDLKAVSDCSSRLAYVNNVMTKELWTAINNNKSSYYEAVIRRTNGTSPDTNAIMTEAAIDTFITQNKNSSATTDSVLLTLYINAKKSARENYNDLEVNYVYPRGSKLDPSLIINDGDTNSSTNAFSNVTALKYEIGAGYDLRAEEFETLSLHTNLNHYPQLSDGIKSDGVVYQFENKTNYNTITFEYDTLKSLQAGSADEKRGLILLGTSNAAIYNKLVTLFGLN